MREQPIIVAVVGATASGKSDLALDLAELADGEIVNADAMQLYRGMDIGTAKLPPGERRGIVHHQLDQLDVREEASVAAYQRHARADIDHIHARGRRAIVAGGSGLYVRALLDDLDFPGTDPAVRERIAHRADKIGPKALHRELADLDPQAAAAIEPANARRIVRALEVIELTGRPFAASLPEPRFHRPTQVIGLRPDLDWLDARIGRRVEQMLEAGLLAEVEELVSRGLREGKTARRAVGYRQALAYLDGEMGAGDQAIRALADAIALATRQLARRQIKWFRRDPRIEWIDVPLEPAALAERARGIVGV